ncbi:uncharacterized protein PAC_05876 [Phialocephala subalpina]|uniref:Fungal N-terminal domain-containing protein n=1 Tax=Phialocephala subalpina TaxID=576137 RepID=A0A1L7WT72_9HELO|nr:uncharacterized protein PAC_05876 [Phialocephala subalpina]
MHKVLQRLHHGLADPKSILHRSDNERANELQEVVAGCEGILRVVDSTVKKYDALGDNKRAGKKLWKKIKFGNGEVGDLAALRLKLSTHTSAISMMITLCQSGSQGRMEEKLTNVGGDLEGIRSKVDWIAAKMAAQNKDGTVWTTYTNDDRILWRQLRTELNREGYDSSVLRKYKHLIKSYVRELGKRGAFDQVGFDEDPIVDENLPISDIKDQKEQDSKETYRSHLEDYSETSSHSLEAVHVDEWSSDRECDVPSPPESTDFAPSVNCSITLMLDDTDVIGGRDLNSPTVDHHARQVNDDLQSRQEKVEHIPNPSHRITPDRANSNSTSEEYEFAYEYAYDSKKYPYGRNYDTSGWNHLTMSKKVSFCPYRVSAVGGAVSLRDT